jgi:hypothetical protein
MNASFIYKILKNRNIFPENLIQATIQQGQTYYTYESSKLVKVENLSSISSKKYSFFTFYRMFQR